MVHSSILWFIYKHNLDNNEIHPVMFLNYSLYYTPEMHSQSCGFGIGASKGTQFSIDRSKQKFWSMDFMEFDRKSSEAYSMGQQNKIKTK